MSNISRNALKLSEIGISCHWLHQRSKKPLEANWSTAQTKTPEQLKESYKAGCNLGIRPGIHSKVGDHYLHLLDVDVRRGDGEGAQEVVKKVLGPKIKSYPIVKSGSGGNSRHVWFLAPEPMGSKLLATSEKKFFDTKTKSHRYEWEVELYGTGKQAVAPPSIHPDTGAAYAWAVEPDLDDMELGLAHVLPDSGFQWLKDHVRVRVNGESSEADPFASLKPPLDINTADVAYYLSKYGNDDRHYDEYLMVGQCLHHQYEGGPEGLELWHEWASGSSKYDADDLDRRYESFGLGGHVPVTFASIIHLTGGKAPAMEMAGRKLDEAGTVAEMIEAVGSEARLQDWELDALANTIKKRAKEDGQTVSLSAIKKSLARRHADAHTEHVGDLENRFAKAFLRDKFPGKRLMAFGKKWWHHTGGVWRIADHAWIRGKVMRYIEQIREDEERNAVFGTLFADSGKGSNQLTNTMVAVIEARVSRNLSDDPLRLAEPPVASYINLKNGTLWFDDDEGGYTFRDHDPADYLTKLVAVDYQPGTDCPTWDSMLHGIFAKHQDPAESVRHMEEVLGYVLQSTRQIPLFQLWTGGGSNGKSALKEVLMALMGNSAGSTHINKLETAGEHMGASLVGMLLLADDDMSAKTVLPDGMIKRYSEGKRETANPKYGDHFPFYSTVMFLGLSNHYPRIQDASFGLDRRMMCTPFNRCFGPQEADPRIAERIIKWELPGVINRLAQGWQRVRHRGLQWQLPVDVVKATQEVLHSGSSVRSFCAEHLQEEQGSQIPMSEVWSEYQTWCHQEGMSYMLQRRQFGRELEQLGYVIEQGRSRTKRLLGVKFVDRPSDRDGFGDEESDDMTA